jgi:hypothetical protein
MAESRRSLSFYSAKLIFTVLNIARSHNSPYISHCLPHKMSNSFHHRLRNLPVLHTHQMSQNLPQDCNMYGTVYTSGLFSQTREYTIHRLGTFSHDCNYGPACREWVQCPPLFTLTSSSTRVTVRRPLHPHPSKIIET